jgi:hypothetical protein
MAYSYNATLCARVHLVNFGFPKPQVGSSNLPRVTIESMTCKTLAKSHYPLVPVCYRFQVERNMAHRRRMKHAASYRLRRSQGQSIDYGKNGF